jgi:hypothetical protein
MNGRCAVPRSLRSSGTCVWISCGVAKKCSALVARKGVPVRSAGVDLRGGVVYANFLADDVVSRYWEDERRTTTYVLMCHLRTLIVLLSLICSSTS